MEYTFRIFDFNVTSEKNIEKDQDSSDNGRDERPVYRDDEKFLIQIFGKDENGKTYSVNVEDFKPFFYVLVDEHWTKQTKDSFLLFIKSKIGKYYENSITDCIIIKEKNYMVLIAVKNINLLNLNFQA